jgi:acyl-CoA synthetase (NDP forming)
MRLGHHGRTPAVHVMSLTDLRGVRVTRADRSQAQHLCAEFVYHRPQHQKGTLLQHKVTANIVDRCSSAAHSEGLRIKLASFQKRKFRARLTCGN